MTDIETRGTQVEKGWLDRDGFVGPYQPGVGPRTNPKGEYATGPEVGQPLPDVQCATADGSPLELHAHRAGRPALFIIFRSAVW